jgi:peptide/nickel transport system substrate-binding protein
MEACMLRESDIRKMIGEVKDGTLDRRSFINRMLAVGLTAPLAVEMLAHNGVAIAQTKAFEYKGKKGGAGNLRLIWWQGPTLLNPHFAVGTKDQDGSRLFYEPLAGWTPDGELFPVLAAELPSKANGGLAADGMSVTWKIKPNVKWHDGKPLTADDFVFNWEYAKDPATATVTIGVYKDITVEKVDDLTIRIKFKQPTPFWADAFCGARGMVIPKHLFADFMGGKSREAPNNLKPIGTGPYKFVDFKPGDLIRGERNPDYHMPDRPHFDTIEMKGGGDAVSAARAVLQTGEYDFAWNVQVEEEVLSRLEKGGKGNVTIADAADIEFVQMHTRDPWTEVDGERASMKTTHPTLSDPAVRKAITLLVDRKSAQQHIYGRAGIATSNFLNAPPQYASKNTSYEFDVDKANKILDDAGWKRGADGIREKGGKKLKYVFQTSNAAPRQKTQAVIKQAFQKAGIEVELKSVVASVFFSSDVANPDTYGKFYADLQMYTTTSTSVDPNDFMNQYLSDQVSTKENKWQGRNISRWTNKEYDETYAAQKAELDPVKRAALFIKLNDLVIKNDVVVPIISRPRVAVRANNIMSYVSGWDSNIGGLHNWYRIG